jgi:hypothetical protein
MITVLIGLSLGINWFPPACCDAWALNKYPEHIKKCVPESKCKEEKMRCRTIAFESTDNSKPVRACMSNYEWDCAFNSYHKCHKHCAICERNK